jgi:hypothetical protein
VPKYVGMITDYNIIVYVVCTFSWLSKKEIWKDCCFGHVIHTLVDRWKYENMLGRGHLEEDMEVCVGLQGHCDAELAVSGFKTGALTYLVVLLGRILDR